MPDSVHQILVLRVKSSRPNVPHRLAILDYQATGGQTSHMGEILVFHLVTVRICRVCIRGTVLRVGSGSCAVAGSPTCKRWRVQLSNRNQKAQPTFHFCERLVSVCPQINREPIFFASHRSSSPYSPPRDTWSELSSHEVQPAS